MYHYVRPDTQLNLRYISVKNFEKQLDYINNTYGIITQDEWNKFRTTGKIPQGALLTFDDGLKDHIDHVLPILLKWNLFAVFYVCTDPIYGAPLTAHLTHDLISKFSAKDILVKLSQKNLAINMNLEFDNKARNAYSDFSQDESEKYLKRVINWLHLNLGQKKFISDIYCELTGMALCDFVRDWYLTELEIKKIYNLGFEIGSHTCSHRLLSNLDDTELEIELIDSKSILSDLLSQEVKSFCFPYGGSHSYNKKVIETLIRNGYTESFSVNPVPIDLHSKFKQSYYELPRYDCNLFPNYQ